MYSKEILALDDVKRVATAAAAEAQRNGWNVVIAVVDDGGHLMYLQREKVQLGSIDVAITKGVFRSNTTVKSLALSVSAA